MAYSASTSIQIFADARDVLNTLEPQIVDANKKNLALLCEIIEIDNKKYDTEKKIVDYMIENKTDWAFYRRG